MRIYLNSLQNIEISSKIVRIKMAWIGFLLFSLLVESCRASGCTGHQKGSMPANSCHGPTVKYDESFLVEFSAENANSKCVCRVTSSRMKSPQFDLTEKYCKLRTSNTDKLCEEKRNKIALLKDGRLHLKFEMIRRNNKHFLCAEVDDDYLGVDIDEDSLALDCSQNSSRSSSVGRSSTPSGSRDTPRGLDIGSSGSVVSGSKPSDRKSALNRQDRLKVDESSKDMSRGAIAGIVIGVIAICALIIGLSILFLLRYRRSGTLWPKPMNIVYGTSEMDVRIVSESKIRGDEPSSNYYSSYLVAPPNLKEGKTMSEAVKKGIDSDRPPVAPRPKVFTQINKKEQPGSDPCIDIDNVHYIEPISPDKSAVSSHSQLRPEYSNNKQCTDNDYLTPINSDVTTGNEYVEPCLIENATKVADERGPEVTNSEFNESESIYETIA